MLDLIALVADNYMRLTIEGLLGRPHRLETRPITAEVITPAGWFDAGVYKRCHDFLRSQQKFASFALVVLDRKGCGRDAPRELIEEDLEARLASSGWPGRSAAIVIDPELEAWVWSDSPHVDRALKWTKGRPQLEVWLAQNGFSRPGQQKPHLPKKAVQKLLSLSKTPPSPSIYRELAEQVSFKRCTDPAFLKLKQVLQHWFPQKDSIGES